jgi:hypothetical protein
VLGIPGILGEGAELMGCKVRSNCTSITGETVIHEIQWAPFFLSIVKSKSPGSEDRKAFSLSPLSPACPPLPPAAAATGREGCWSAPPHQPPLSPQELPLLQDSAGRLTDVGAFKRRVFYSGAEPAARPEVWKYLLGLHPEGSRAEVSLSSCEAGGEGGHICVCCVQSQHQS